MIIFPFITLSCTTGNEFDISEINAGIPDDMKSQQRSLYPQNSANPYDRVGRKYMGQLRNYVAQHSNPSSIDEITKQIQFVADRTDILFYKMGTESISKEQILRISKDPVYCAKEIIEKASITPHCQIALSNFFTSLLSARNDSYTDLYNYIVAYESKVMASALLNASDKETILALSSITRYSLYLDDGHKDRDWETSVGNKMSKVTLDPCKSSLVTLIVLLTLLG